MNRHPVVSQVLTWVNRPWVTVTQRCAFSVLAVEGGEYAFTNWDLPALPVRT